MRADPVLSAPHQMLGFVILFTDVSERKAADDARRRFQAGVVERHRVRQALGLDRGPQYRDLLASIVGNAQLAALEITDGPDLTRVPELLSSIQSSVARTAELLRASVEVFRSARRGGRDLVPRSTSSCGLFAAVIPA